jgi:hypothetical protein
MNAPPAPSETKGQEGKQLWYGRPEGRFQQSNHCVFRCFGGLLISTDSRRSVPMDRYLFCSFFRVPERRVHENRVALQRSYLRRRHLGALRRKFKPQPPFARHAFPVYFRRCEGPLSRSLQRKVGEELAWSWRIELGARYAAGRIDMHFHTDTHLAVNRGARLFGNVGQNLVEHFALRRTGDNRSCLGGFRGGGRSDRRG